MVCEEKLDSRVRQASCEEGAKSTMPATDDINEDWIALRIA
jgi:hypothetical protein